LYGRFVRYAHLLFVHVLQLRFCFLKLITLLLCRAGAIPLVRILCSQSGGHREVGPTPHHRYHTSVLLFTYINLRCGALVQNFEVLCTTGEARWGCISLRSVPCTSVIRSSAHIERLVWRLSITGIFSVPVTREERISADLLHNTI
jgi:hypothetical protein